MINRKSRNFKVYYFLILIKHFWKKNYKKSFYVPKQDFGRVWVESIFLKFIAYYGTVSCLMVCTKTLNLFFFIAFYIQCLINYKSRWVRNVPCWFSSSGFRKRSIKAFVNWWKKSQNHFFSWGIEMNPRFFRARRVRNVHDHLVMLDGL